MFKLFSEFKASGDQPEAVKAVYDGIKNAQRYQTIQGVTGSGKTFTLANIIEKIDRPVLVLSHNKTLAAQLYSEFKAFFPNNAVEYFISYYDYYLPEAYIPQTDTYIAKDASINENIERLRLSATASLMQRRDVIVVASVSCIYGLGSPADYEDMCVTLKQGDSVKRDELLKKLVMIQYERNDTAPSQGEFRVRGDSLDVFLPQKEEFIRIELWGTQVENLYICDVLTGKIKEKISKAVFFPCKHFVMPQDRIESSISKIMTEMRERVSHFEKNGLLVEAQRIYQRVNYDMEMLREIGYCSGIENYSMHLSNRLPGSRPSCLIDFFPKDFLTVIDESHATMPQLNAMYKADRSRKETLVEHGFRLPSAMENRPLKFDEFKEITGQTVFVSATPGDYELSLCPKPIELVVRPTGLLDPEISVRPLNNQIDDVMAEIRECAAKHERILVTTLTKKNAERLADYLGELGLRVKYLHSEIDAIERVRILSELRKGQFDCLIGINLLREGIDLPEVTLVAILDADKEGFLRSERSLIQVAGRAARNVCGRVILYADKITDSMAALINITAERRKKQMEYNKKHGIIPKTISKAIREDISDIIAPKKKDSYADGDSEHGSLLAAMEEKAPYNARRHKDEIEDLILELEREMLEAAESLEFERAASLRDKIKSLKEDMNF